jgi:hypothetical protein
MAKISKPDANPMVAVILTWFVFQTGHLLTNGQKEKFIKVLIGWLIAYCLCCLPGPIFHILSIIDSYKTAEKLKAGKEVDEHEYSFKPFFSIMKILDKQATLVE